MPRTIYVEIPRTAYYTGEILEGTVVVETTRDVECHGLYVDVLGREETKIERGSGKNHRVYRTSRDHVTWRLPLLGAGEVHPGVFRLPFRFQLPTEALPSYQGRHAWIKYTLTARLDIPLWLDTVWTGEISVFYDRRSVRQFARPARFRSGGEGPEVYVELDGDRFFAREVIGCRITLDRLGSARVRRVFVRLVGYEWARADGTEETTQSYRREWSIPMEIVRVGVPFEFELPIPADVPSAFRGATSYYAYVLQVGLDVAWGFDIVAQTPLVIVR